MDKLSDFGLGATLIAAFFIPAIWKLYKRNQEIQDARIDDWKGINLKLLELMKEIRDAAIVTGEKSEAIYTFAKKMERFIGGTSTDEQER